MQCRMSASRKIRELRKRLGLKQEEFAAHLGVSQTSISRWESGTQEPDFKMMMEIARFANIDPIKFAFEDERDAQNIPLTDDWRYVNIVGAIEKDLWTESVYWEKSSFIRITMPLAIPNGYNIDAFIIRDDSGHPRFPPATILFTAMYNGRTLKPNTGDYLVYYREDDRGLNHLEVREAIWMKDGSLALAPLLFEGSVVEIDKETIRGAVGSELALFELGIVGMVCATFIDEALGRLVEIPPEPSGAS